jgi:hypothetical protein
MILAKFNFTSLSSSFSFPALQTSLKFVLNHLSSPFNLTESFSFIKQKSNKTVGLFNNTKSFKLIFKGFNSKLLSSKWHEKVTFIHKEVVNFFFFWSVCIKNVITISLSNLLFFLFYLSEVRVTSNFQDNRRNFSSLYIVLH